MAPFRPSVRAVMGILCAVTVLVVAGTTLAITYVVSLNTARDLGKRLTLSLAQTAQVETRDYFNVPVMQGEAAQMAFLQNGVDLPSRLPDQSDPRMSNIAYDLMSSVFRMSNFSYSSFGFLLDDGSGGGGHPIRIGGVRYLYFHYRHRGDYPTNDMIAWHRIVDLSTLEELPNASTVRALDANLDMRFGPFHKLKPRYVNNTNMVGRFVGASVISHDFAPTVSVMPLLTPLRNRQRDFIGFNIITIPLTTISDFLRGLQGTPGTEAFAVDSRGLLVATSRAESFINFTETPDPRPTGLPPNCASSAGHNAVHRFRFSTWIACRSYARDFTASPTLVAVAEVDGGAFLTSATTDVRIVKHDGSNIYAASAPVPSRAAGLSLNVVLTVPEDDVLGDIVAGRNLAIIVTCVVFVVATIASVIAVNIILRPLSEVSEQMLVTARLRDAESIDSYSSLGEIRVLQKAFTSMSTAVRSFTRYVPRDVVKDLMASGELCTIQMTPMRCTMLFVDIAGFTSVCERVPADVLSDLVTAYFERASKIVMDHDGLIDKYIGDCIMAVWGAPFAVVNHEVKATLAGKLIDRETAVDPLASEWDSAGELLRVRVGISSGDVLAGNMGSQERMSYTVIGDNVNLAARLESMNKQFDTRVMVCEETAESLHGVFVLRLLMPIAVVGKEKPVKVYEVMGLQRDISSADREALKAADDAVGVETGDFSDSDSMYSSARASSIGSGGGKSTRTRRSKRPTLALINDAQVRTATENQVVCTTEEMAVANLHNQALEHYLAADFVSARRVFDKLDATHKAVLDGFSAPTRTSAPRRSVELIRGLCDKYIAEGCPADFDGVYRALEK